MIRNCPKIIINPIGGLANRMRALASGISLARELDCDFRVIWYRNWELNANMEDIFELSDELKERVIYPDSFTYSTIYSVPRKRNLYITALTSRLFFGGVFRDDMKDLLPLLTGDYAIVKSMAKDSLNKGRDFLMQGGIIMYPYSTELYRSIFKPSQQILQKVNKVMSSIGGQSIGIHIRRSDNIESIQHSPDELFIQEMDSALRSNPDVSFYLATDDELTKARFSERYGKRLFFSHCKAERGNPEGIINAAVEMYVLSRTDQIIGSHYSSFSEAAASLGDKLLKQVYTK